MKIAERKLLEQSPHVPEARLILARETDHDVGAQTDIGNAPEHIFKKCDVLFDRIESPHVPQNPVVTVLQRNVQVTAQLLRVGHVLHQRIRNRRRLDRTDSNALQTVDAFEHPDNIQQLSLLEFVRADVDPAENNFAVSSFHQRDGLALNIPESATARPAPGKRDNAEGAHKVAAVL